VVIHEMRPKVGTFAHSCTGKVGTWREMVCSNSFRSDDDEQNAVGLLHWEMRAAGGLIMEMADRHKPARRRRAGRGPRPLCRSRDGAAQRAPERHRGRC
jgi:folate-dependent tRNA-U54 methylase TrmFO/GidA